MNIHPDLSKDQPDGVLLDRSCLAPLFSPESCSEEDPRCSPLLKMKAMAIDLCDVLLDGSCTSTRLSMDPGWARAQKAKQG